MTTTTTAQCADCTLALDMIARDGLAHTCVTHGAPVNVRELAVEVDTILGNLYSARFLHEQMASIAADIIRRESSQTREEFRTSRWGPVTYGPWSGTLAEAIDEVENFTGYRADYGQKAVRDYRHHIAQLNQIDIESAEGNAVYREYRWTRAFLVINSNGHVHNGMDCSTCFPTTRYEWLTYYSAADEDEIVAAAGEQACTVCYPSAPAEVLNRPSDLVSKTRAEKEAAQAVRAAEKAAREAKRRAKAPTASGDPLVVPQDEWGHDNATLNTEVTARKTWNGIQDKRRGRSYGRPATQQQVDAMYLIEGALAEKYGVTRNEMRDQLLARYAKRRPQ